ncbi:uncharacterized protein LOC9300880 [Arabidopsis lyrata subsp. lyrata]|uniref:uncharacterized protein LOC9300880 n=1 Tax=Arabidopsis lyrata subsp. lyrata TaxID=81972 RepID=UPI000A29A585|nr:uncharacterized protein LOC9300880 [Arabidopsis lyrata subsp. lyrata]|eukprot:XP_020871076.1 uncharacterized protein LOC9300880 [Arabidopsis lyrata subsp. lyrata]
MKKSGKKNLTAAAETILNESAMSTSIVSGNASSEKQHSDSDSDSIPSKESSYEMASSDDNLTDIEVSNVGTSLPRSDSQVVHVNGQPGLTVNRNHLIRDLPRPVQRPPVVQVSQPQLSRSARKKLNRGPGTMSLTAAQKRMFGHRKGKKKHRRRKYGHSY